ncbi:MAG: asb2a [Gammaproteobacteria bacterium]|jgi:ankyrin repeat protein|nr:asb2a [Gammaproteobacteria bacterium]
MNRHSAILNFFKEHYAAYEELITAIVDEDPSVVENLLNQNPTLKNKYFRCEHEHLTILHLAVLLNSTKVVDLLLRIEPKIVNLPDRSNIPPLDLDFRIEDHPDLTVLHYIDIPEDTSLYYINIPAGQRYSPLILAIEQRNISMVKRLLEDPLIDVNDKNNIYFQPPIIKALNTEVTEIINALLNDSRFNINWVDEFGDNNTLLHHAVLRNNLELTLTLIKKGIKIDLVNQKGLTPLALAVQKGHREIALALAQQGAQLTYYEERFLHTWIRDSMLVDNSRLLKDLSIQVKIKGIWDLWERYQPDYTSYLQWLPQEIVEDEIALSVTPASPT